jgi:hypothetical protein
MIVERRGAPRPGASKMRKRKRRSEMLKAIAAKGRERATDVLLVGSAFVGCVGLLAAAHG